MRWVCGGVLAGCLALALPASGQNGASLYQQYCAQCHDSGGARIPPRSTLQQLSRAQILSALEGSPMRAQGAQRTAAERRAIAAFLAHPDASAASSLPAGAACRGAPAPMSAAAQWSGWGANLANTRFQDAGQAGLNAAQVPQLRLRWAFGFPGAISAAAQPTIVGGRVFVGSADGRVYALDLQRGCVYWTFDAAQAVRTAVVVARTGQRPGAYTAYFVDRSANVYSVDAQTGVLHWKQRVGDGAVSATGSPAYYQGRLYVPLTGNEEGAGGSPRYPCCRSHGSVVALDAESGRVIWQASTLREPPHPTRVNAAGTQLYGPSGAGVWSAPTIDTEARRLYVATGDSYSDPAGDTSDAVLAFDLNTGQMLWSHQATSMDAYNSGCDLSDKSGCPQENGPDFDFGQPPLLVSRTDGQRMLVVGQKSGLVYALDPDHGGCELWRRRVGTGGVLGGINWGSASDGINAYVAVSDRLDLVQRDAKLNPEAGGIASIHLIDGRLLWRTRVSGCDVHEGSLQRLHPPEPGQAPPDFGCSPAQSAPVTVIPGVVFSGSEDGHLRAYDSASGRVVWDFDTARDFETVDFVDAHGGSIDGGGPAVAGGFVLTTSGYSKWGEMRGNVLLAFSIADPGDAH
jgi:polyvinyl alcohol dehydrogenase (cytochrome)